MSKINFIRMPILVETLRMLQRDIENNKRCSNMHIFKDIDQKTVMRY